MSRALRLGLVAAALVIAVAAFVALRPSDDEQDDQSSRPAAGAQQPQAENSEKQEKAAVIPVLRPGSVTKIQVEKGNRVRFAVRSPQADEAHVHGYDLLKKVPAGRTVRFDFRATLEGAFEVELELSEQQIGALEVTP